MPGAVKETPHAMAIWKGIERKKEGLVADPSGEGETSREDAILEVEERKIRDLGGSVAIGVKLVFISFMGLSVQ